MTDINTVQNNETTDEPAERTQSERDEFIGGLAERARKERDDFMVKHGHTPIDTSGTEQSSEQDNDDTVTHESEKQAAEHNHDMVRIKVDGVETEVEREKVFDAGLRAMQKESAADRRLQEATEILRRAEEAAKLTKEQIAHAESPPQQWDDESIAWVLENGTDEDKAQAVGQLRGRNNATPEQIAQRATALALDRLDFESERNRFVSEYDDIVKDPYLLQLAISAEDKAIASGDKRPRRELYKEIGEGIRSWKGGLSGGTSSMDDKRAAKTNIVNLPSASSKNTAPEQKKPLTASQVIEDIRKSRGGR